MNQAFYNNISKIIGEALEVKVKEPLLEKIMKEVNNEQILNKLPQILTKLEIFKKIDETLQSPADDSSSDEESTPKKDQNSDNVDGSDEPLPKKFGAPSHEPDVVEEVDDSDDSDTEIEIPVEDETFDETELVEELAEEPVEEPVEEHVEKNVEKPIVEQGDFDLPKDSNDVPKKIAEWNQRTKGGKKVLNLDTNRALDVTSLKIPSMYKTILSCSLGNLTIVSEKDFEKSEAWKNFVKLVPQSSGEQVISLEESVKQIIKETPRILRAGITKKLQNKNIIFTSPELTEALNKLKESNEITCDKNNRYILDDLSLHT
jgi:hypothetical protein